VTNGWLNLAHTWVVQSSTQAVEHADAVLAEVLPAYPESSTFGYFNARMLRGKKDLAGATAALLEIDCSTLPACVNWLTMFGLRAPAPAPAPVLCP
jgi:hypothetical protein